MRFHAEFHRLTKLPIPKGTFVDFCFDTNDKPKLRKACTAEGSNGRVIEDITAHRVLVTGNIYNVSIHNGE